MDTEDDYKKDDFKPPTRWRFWIVFGLIILGTIAALILDSRGTGS